jgi:hypothetical protein
MLVESAIRILIYGLTDIYLAIDQICYSVNFTKHILFCDHDRKHIKKIRDIC